MRPITYPARPINGGPLPLAAPKTGRWLYEPKFNGWRALIHTPTGTVFNRHGRLLSIRDEFGDALLTLRKLPFEWMDVEALQRRHRIARGTLIVLDAVMPGSYEQRRSALERCLTLAEPPSSIRPDSVYLTPSLECPPWEELQAANASCGDEFYEGVVAKRADSIYPVQLRNPDEAFPFWVKHRWRF